MHIHSDIYTGNERLTIKGDNSLTCEEWRWSPSISEYMYSTRNSIVYVHNDHKCLSIFYTTTFIWYCRERRMLAPVVSFLWVEILQQSKTLKMDPLKCLPSTTPIGHMTASRRMGRVCLLRGLVPLNTQTRYRFLNSSKLLCNGNPIFLWSA